MDQGTGMAAMFVAGERADKKKAAAYGLVGVDRPIRRMMSSSSSDLFLPDFSALPALSR
jgi:hypothetical protein